MPDEKSGLAVEDATGVFVDNGAFGVSAVCGSLMRSNSDRGGCAAGVLETVAVPAEEPIEEGAASGAFVLLFCSLAEFAKRFT